MSEQLSSQQADNKKLPDHVLEFLTLSEELEQALQTKNPVEITQVRSRMKIFYGTLDEEKQHGIQRFIQQEAAGMRIADERSTVMNMMQRTLNAPGMVVHALAETVPQLTGETLRLIVTTLGFAGYGLYRGGKTVRNIFRQAA
jgi:hypothetical protein